MTKNQLVKLKTYESRLFDCFLFKYRDSYLKLFVSFINYSISEDEFSQQLIQQLELMSQLEINFKFLNKCNLDLNAFEFADIIDSVEQDCDSFISDELLAKIGGLREDAKIDENQLYKYIEEAFFLIMVDKKINFHFFL